MTPSSDYALVKRIFQDPRISDRLTDDYTPSDYDIPEALTYLVSDDEDGVVMIVPRNSIEVELHIAVLPEAKHRAYYYGKRALEWIFGYTQYRKATVMIPFTNKQVFKYCKKLGFKEEGINTMSFMKYGELQDQWLLGMTKEDWLCHH